MWQAMGPRALSAATDDPPGSHTLMRIYIASIGDDPPHRAQREVMAELARADRIGAHVATDDPERADAILFTDLHQHPDDPFLGRLRRNAIARAFTDKSFVLDQRDRPTFAGPGIYMSASSRWRRPVRGGPYPVLPNAQSGSPESPNLLASFIGSRTHPVRDQLLELQHPRLLMEDSTGAAVLPWLQDPAETAAPRMRYAEAIRLSKFVLCPRGHGRSSFRIFEAMSAGRVPVVISDDWLPPPRVDWTACAVRIAERDAGRVPAILAGEEARWEERSSAVRVAWEQEIGPSSRWHHYGETLAELARLPQRESPRWWWIQEPVVRLAARRALDRARSIGRPGATRAPFEAAAEPPPRG